MAAVLEQEVTGFGTTDAAGTLIAPTPGRLMLAIVASNSGATNPMDVADDGGASWAQSALGFNSGSTNTRLEIWSAIVPDVSGSDINVIGSSLSANHQIVVQEWSGIDSVAFGEGAGNASSTAAGTHATQPTDEADNILIAAINFNTSSGVRTATHGNTGGGWTVSAIPGASASVGLRVAHKVVSSIGTYDDAWTLSTAAASGWTRLNLTIAAEAGGSGVPVVLLGGL